MTLHTATPRRIKRNIVINDSARAFINSKDTLCTDFLFYSCIGMSSLTVARDETIKIYCPDPNRYDKFIVSERISGRKQDATSAIKTYLPKSNNSILMHLFNKSCTFDMQVHFGTCGLPDAFENFERLLVLQDVELSSYTTDALIALNSTERAPIIETADIVIEGFYELVHQPLITTLNSTIASGPLIDTSVFSTNGTCLCPQDNAIYATQLRENFGGTLAQLFVVYTTDGMNWQELQVTGCDPLDISQLIYSKSVISSSGTNVCLLYFDDGATLGDSISEYINNSLFQFDNTLYTGLTNIYDSVNDGVVLYSAANSSIVLSVNMQSRVIDMYSDSSLPIADLFGIDTFDGTELLIGGANGLLLLLDPQARVFTQLTPIVDGVNIVTDITNVQYIDENVLLFTTIDGINARSCDGGQTWQRMERLIGCVSTMKFYDKYIGYCASADTNGVHLYRSINGGKLWHKLVQQSTTQGFPLTYVITDIGISDGKPDEVAWVGKVSNIVLTPTQICDRALVFDAPSDTGVVITFTN